MFYRPNYCCHCGEKIDRARWTALTSRRFCEFCEIEQKQHDLLPRAALILALLFGSAGLTSYLSSPGKADTTTRRTVSQVQESGPQASAANRTPEHGKVGTSAIQPPTPVDSPPRGTTANLEQRPVPQNSSTEPVYFCGAMTKKGTPCTRRVRSKGHCWQHGGQTSPGSVR
jgi:hypothetical protein